MDTGKIKVSEATTSAAETIALYRADARKLENEARAEHAKMHEARAEAIGVPDAWCSRTQPLPPVDLDAIYAEALEIGMRVLLGQVANGHHPISFYAPPSALIPR